MQKVVIIHTKKFYADNSVNYFYISVFFFDYRIFINIRKTLVKNLFNFDRYLSLYIVIEIYHLQAITKDLSSFE